MAAHKKKREKTTRRRAQATRKTAARPARRTRASAPRGISPSGYKLDDDEVERVLLSGEYQGLLEEYFGEAECRELADLARRASGVSVRGGPRVLIVPGIMGSKLGRKRALIFHDTLWIDPIDIALGNLVQLALPGRGRILPIGVILFAYLKLKLRLRIAGFDADFYPFDWRLSIDALGRDLLARIRRESTSTVHVVAHSMGGLVARAAVSAEKKAGRARKIGRLVMLGTPNFGSFVPVQALRATYPTVAAIAKIDLKNSATDLARKVFRTFPGLHQMLPSPRVWSGVDLYDPAAWPADRPGPDPRILKRVTGVQDGLAKADERFFLVAGVNQETTVGLSLRDGTFVYEQSREGDGTVPLAFAELPGCKTFYVEEAHGSLPNNGSVGSAVIDILSSGDTARLPKQWDRSRARARRQVRQEELEEPSFGDLDPSELGPRERRSLLEPFVSAVAHDRVPAIAGEPKDEEPGPGYGHRFDNVVVSRRRQHALDLRLARGNIAEVDTRSLVLGLFREVEPAGAAGAIDDLLDGAIKEFTTRRMFSGQVGEVFVMPTGRSRIFAESVLFAGLGHFDAFNPEVQEFVAENVVRTFVRTHVEDFATVLMGAASGQPIRTSLYHQLRGFIRGLLDADDDHRLRRITLCERAPERFLELKGELHRLTSTPLFEGIRVTLDEVELPEPVAPVADRGRARARHDFHLAYLILNQIESEEVRRGRADRRREIALRASLLTAGSKAAVLTGTRRIARRDVDRFLNDLKQKLNNRTLAALGSRLAKLTLERDVSKGLEEMKKHHLVVIHDAPASRFPWEILHVGGWAPAAHEGLSRRYSAENLSVAKWLEERRFGDTLDVLLVVNPTLDLDGAEEEAERIKKLFPAEAAIRLHEIRGEDATQRTLLREFGSGRYDVLHYAGHAYFDAEEPSRSGILCHGNRVLSGAHIAGVGNLPALVFFNACESGRTRSRGVQDEPARRRDLVRAVQRNVGLAEAFLRGGVANYIGTYWPVGDRSASVFASTFYRGVVSGKPVGVALQAGRDAVRRAGSIDWADYIHYGNYDFVVKKLGTGTALEDGRS